jgi:hypothetical protein
VYFIDGANEIDQAAIPYIPFYVHVHIFKSKSTVD